MHSSSSTIRVAGVLSVLTGASYVAAAVAAALMPAELAANPDITPHEFWSVLASDPSAHLAMHWSFVAVGIFGIGVVLPLSRYLEDHLFGLISWASMLGILGLAVNARSHLMELAWDRKILADYVSADPSFQQAVHVVAGLALDVPDGVLTLGGVGVWMIAASLAGWRAKRFGVLTAALGVLAGIFFGVGVAGYAVMSQALIVASFIGGTLVFAPAWHFAIGRALLRVQSETCEANQST